MTWALYFLICCATSIFGFAGGIQFANGRTAARELAVQVAATERYHAKEIELNAVASLLEESRAATAEAAMLTAKQVAAIGNRPIYMRDCFDDDGLRIANDALRGTASHPRKPARKVPASSSPR